MKNLIFTVVATLMLSLNIQAQDTLNVGDFTVVTTPTSDTSSKYTVFTKSPVIADYFVPVVELASKEALVEYLYANADAYYSAYGQKEVEAREYARQAGMMSRMLNNFDTVNVVQRGLQKYASQLSGRYILVYKGKRSIVEFDERLIAIRKGEPNLRMLVFSNNNIDIVNLETERISFYAQELGNFFGVDNERGNIRLRKIGGNDQ